MDLFRCLMQCPVVLLLSIRSRSSWQDKTTVKYQTVLFVCLFGFVNFLKFLRLLTLLNLFLFSSLPQTFPYLSSHHALQAWLLYSLIFITFMYVYTFVFLCITFSVPIVLTTFMYSRLTIRHWTTN